MYGLSQLIDCPTRITSNTSTLIDHILTNTQENISQSCVSEKSQKQNTTDTRNKFLLFEKLLDWWTLERVSFPNFENFANPDIAYSGFITRLDCAINAIALFKTIRIENNTSEWFDGKIAEKIHTRQTL